MKSEDIESLTDEQLIEFADSKLSIVIPPGTKRSVIMTKIVNAAIGARSV